MKKSIFCSVCAAAAAVFLAALTLIFGVLYSYFSDDQQRNLREQTALVALAVEHEGMKYFDGFPDADGNPLFDDRAAQIVPQARTDDAVRRESSEAGRRETRVAGRDVASGASRAGGLLPIGGTGFRVTWIGRDGEVLYDSLADTDAVENHLDRHEVRMALSIGWGESARYSSTLMERQIYAACRLNDDTVIRLSGEHMTVLSLLLRMLQPILMVCVTALALAFVLASRLSRKIVRPLNGLDLDSPMSNSVYEELRPLLNRIDSQQKRLKSQEAELRRNRDEFEAATDNMSEGLVLLDNDGIIISINRAASRLLSASRYCIGKDILLLNNSLAMQELLRGARGGEHTEASMRLDSSASGNPRGGTPGNPRSGTEYRLSASPVPSDEGVCGIVLLIFDVTEREKSELQRREFTANVSHELKTPLHSISGCAELLKDGMVRPEDVARFSSRIYAEAQLMVRLVDDIINLSRLDEGAENMEREVIDVYAVAEKIIGMLRHDADAAGVSVSLTGEHLCVKSVPNLLNAIVFNFIDNAVKYNRRNGSVSVDVRREENGVLLSVTDTGIGIAEEHLERIFERFYRVNKGKSKSVGGSGLGLSIAKHAAKLLGASIELNSVLDGGTAVAVRNRTLGHKRHAVSAGCACFMAKRLVFR